MKPTVLLVEDSKDDIVFMRRALSRSNIPLSLQVLEDGTQAMAYLEGRDAFADRNLHPLPNLILLDLKMPAVSGFEVLRWVRTQPNLSALIVVILTSSDHPADIRQAYALGANSFLTKPGRSNELAALVQSLADYWLSKNVNGFLSPLRRSLY